MPAIQISPDATAPQLDSLAPRSLHDLTARHPEFALAGDSAVTLDALLKRSALEKRVVQGIIPTYYNFSGPTPGTVAGIVLGSVAGFLLLVWLLWSLTTISGGGAAIAGGEEIVVRRRRGSHGTHSRRSRGTEVREYSRSPRRRSTVIVEERRAPRPRSIVVEERSRSRVPGDDIVEVIEEHDEYRSRRGSRRSGGYH